MHLTDDDVTRLVDLPSLTDATERAFRALAEGMASSTVRVRASAGGSMASAMAAALPSERVTGGKLYATVDGRFTFLIVLFDLDGGIVATVDGDALTRLRTAAGTAVAIRHLAPSTATDAALFGTGRQSTGHARMLASELDLRDLRVVGRSRAAADAVVAELAADGIPARVIDDPAVAVDGAGVVVTVTSSDTALFPGRALADDVLVAAVGATKATRRELDAETVRGADVVVVDSLAGSRTECGDLIQAEVEGAFTWDRAVELADVVAGGVQAGRPGRVVFESQGIALQDVAGAALAARRAGLL